MNNRALEQDFWNFETSVEISKLTALDIKVKQNPSNPNEVMVGQLFTAAAHMTTVNNENIDVVVTGFLRRSMDPAQPRNWTAADCFAPRKHNNSVPPVRLTQYPKNLCSKAGDPLRPMDISRLIAQQLDENSDWREQVCSKLAPITVETINYAMNELKVDAGEAEQKPAVVDGPNVHQIKREPAPAESTSVQEPEPEAPAEAAEVADQPSVSETPAHTQEEDKIDLDDFDLDDDGAAQQEEAITAKPVENESEEPISLDDDEDMASIVDEWDEEDASDLNSLESGVASDAMDSLAELNDDSDIQPHQPSGTAPDLGVADEPTPSEFDLATPGSEIRPELAPASEAEVPATPAEQPTASAPPEPSRPAPSEPSMSVSEPAAPVQPPAQPTGEPKAVHREHILNNDNDYDIGFIGIEHGAAAVRESEGETGTLYTTKGGMRVVHIDDSRVMAFKPDETDRLFELMGFDRKAKNLYKSAGVSCVKWLE